MEYLAFYDIARMRESVESTAPVAIESSRVVSELLPLLKESGEFFGLIDADGTTLQVLYDSEEDRYWVEVPRPDLGGSIGRMVDWDSVKDLFSNLGETFPKDSFEGFSFQSWS